MKELSEKEVKVMAELAAFADMPGFPKNEAAVVAVAVAYAKFLHVKTPAEIFRRAAPAEEEQTDLAWLCGEIWDRFEFFPRPIQARDLHHHKFPAADGRNPDEMTASVGEM